MKKLTAGILTVMLGIVSANSADAAVASKLYVDQKAKVNADAITGLTTTVNQHTTEIGELEQADTIISNLVGTLPEGTDATTIVGYIQERTDNIATDAALGELSDKVTANTGAIEKLNGTGDGSVANTIAGAITALDLANTYASKTTVETAYQSAINTAEQNAKDYAAGLAGNYATSAQGALAVAADTLSKENKATLDALDQTYATDGQVATAKQEAIDAAAADATTKADAAEADAIAAAKTETESQISNLNLNELSRVPAECSDAKNYCVLTTNGTNYLWEVIERATDETQPEGIAIPSVTTSVTGA